MILLDTHVLIWLVEDSGRLGPSARQAITADAGAIMLSAMTFWELGMLASKRRITLALPLPRLLRQVTGAYGMTVAPVTAEIALDAHLLPDLHGDPADRLLMATARSLDCAMVTADHVIAAYARAGHVRAIHAAR